MTARFHLSFPVTSLDVSLDFYVQCLGARPGRRTNAWCDVHLYEHQLTLHEAPDHVPASASQSTWHFGVNLDPAEFDAIVERLQATVPATDLFQSRQAARAKVIARDPDGYRIELKAVHHDDTSDAARTG